MRYEIYDLSTDELRQELANCRLHGSSQEWHSWVAWMTDELEERAAGEDIFCAINSMEEALQGGGSEFDDDVDDRAAAYGAGGEPAAPEHNSVLSTATNSPQAVRKPPVDDIAKFKQQAEDRLRRQKGGGRRNQGKSKNLYSAWKQEDEVAEVDRAVAVEHGFALPAVRLVSPSPKRAHANAAGGSRAQAVRASAPQAATRAATRAPEIWRASSEQEAAGVGRGAEGVSAALEVGASALDQRISISSAQEERQQVWLQQQAAEAHAESEQQQQRARQQAEQRRDELARKQREREAEQEVWPHGAMRRVGT
jgi:hypothetical protein